MYLCNASVLQMMDEIRSDIEFTGLKPVFASKPSVIAGPCSAETREQVLSAARALAAGGVGVFRAGVWKPRTKPGGFEGVGSIGLEWLAEVKRDTGMLTVTEVATAGHVYEAVASGIDGVWIGARTSANPFAVQEIADAIASCKADIGVLVKNPVSPDLDLWEGALMRCYKAGIRRLGAIHRGFTTDGHSYYRNFPRWHIATALHLRIPGMPIFCDPSHIGGRRDLVEPISRQALDMGFSGLIIESHCSPDEAWSDASQQITPAELLGMMSRLTPRGDNHSDDMLERLREKIDDVDARLLDILNERMSISREIGRFKQKANIPVLQAERYNDIIRSRAQTGIDMGLSEQFMRTLLMAIHDESVRQQLELSKGNEL